MLSLWKNLYAKNISLLFREKIIMTNQSLNKMLILLIFSWKFISLSKYFLVRAMIMSFVYILIRNIYLKIVLTRTKDNFYLGWREKMKD
jgi:hypothetical protein